jgi:gliding motility-associated-like protein
MAQNITAADSLVLVQIYTATGGTEWRTPWNLSERASRWSGVSVNNQGRVVSLSLANQGMTGTLPAQIFTLSGLNTLNLSSNPELNANLNVIRQMTQLRNLYLAGMRYENNDLPPLNSLSNLEFLDLSSNRLTAFPLFLSSMPNLKHLYLGFNRITEVPAFVGNLLGLETLHLQNNIIAGNFPASMANLVRMRDFRADNNRIEGGLSLSLPFWLNLESIIVSNNKISDTITYKIGDMANLRNVQLNKNNFYNILPPTLSKLRKLAYLDVSDNIITGAIPPQIGQVTSLGYLNIARNRFNLGIPPTFSDLVNLYFFDCSSNNLGGSLPANFGNLKLLQHLDISKNQFNGDFPASVVGLEKLTYFDMSSNSFYYDNLQLITTFTALRHLDISKNLIARPLPNDLGKLTDLVYFNFSQNFIPGEIPASIGNLRKLQRLLGNNNRLSGGVPYSINSAKSLIELDISFNQILDFPVLDSIKLNILRVNNNRLTFEDLEPNIRSANLFVYSPQAKIVLEQPCLLKANVGGRYNRYKWFFSGTAVSECGCDTINTYLANRPGAYMCEIRNDSVKNLVISSEVVNISPLQVAPTVELGKDTVFCQFPFSYVLDGGDAEEYLWSNGATGRYLTVTEPGVYFVRAKKTICTITDTVRIFHAGAKNNIIGPEQIICKDEAPKPLTGGASSSWHRYIWQTSDDKRNWKNVAETKDYAPPKENRAIAYYRRLVVSDTCGEQASNIVSIKISDITLESVLVANVSCPGEKDGIINLRIRGGVAPVRIISDISPDSVTTIFRNLGAGTYNFKITDGAGCEINVNAEIKEPEPLLLTAEVIPASCKSTEKDGKINLFVKGGTPPYRFSWNDGEFLTQNLSGLSDDESKIYRVEVTDLRGCKAVFETRMYRRPVFDVKFSYENAHYCTTESNPKPITNREHGIFYALEVGISLNPKTGEIHLANSSSGEYRIVYEYDACSKDTFSLRIEDKCLENLPNTITPNGDGANDVWDSPVFERFPNMVVRIFDRAGRMLFESEAGYKQKWNATFEGYDLPQDTYYYVIEFNSPETSAKNQSGFITVLRE